MSPSAGRPLAVVDLDGVLADVRHRLNHLERRPKEWDAFFDAAVADPVLPEGRAVVDRLVAEGHDLVYLTGRPERLRAETEEWLSAHGLPPARLLMRTPGDRRPARLTKVGVLRRLAAQQTVAVMVDDDVAVVEAVRAAGFTVLHADWMAAAPALFEAQEAEGRT